MKVKVLAPEITVGDKRYESGKTVTTQGVELERFLRWNYVEAVEEAADDDLPEVVDATKGDMPRANKARTPENKEA